MSRAVLAARRFQPACRLKLPDQALGGQLTIDRGIADNQNFPPLESPRFELGVFLQYSLGGDWHAEIKEEFAPFPRFATNVKLRAEQLSNMPADGRAEPDPALSSSTRVFQLHKRLKERPL